MELLFGKGFFFLTSRDSYVLQSPSLEMFLNGLDKLESGIASKTRTDEDYG